MSAGPPFAGPTVLNAADEDPAVSSAKKKTPELR
jgi:hypothetical protein